VDGSVPACDGQPGRVVACHWTGVLNGSGMCRTREEYTADIAPHLLDVYAIVYPPALELAECSGIVEPLVIVKDDLDDRLDGALVARLTAEGWHVAETLGWLPRPSGYDPCIGIPTELLIPWPE
jgi:hypothetical protein